MSWRIEASKLILQVVKGNKLFWFKSNSGVTIRNYSRSPGALNEGADDTNAQETWSRNVFSSSKKSFRRPGPPNPEKEEWEAANIASHIYKNICSWKSKEELADFLCGNIVYESNGIIAINKPSGVGVRNDLKRREVKREQTLNEGKPDPKKRETITNLYHSRSLASTHYTLEDIVPLLREKLGLPELQLVKSPEKLTSGVAIFGMNEIISKKIQLSSKKTKGQKILSSNYLIVSTNIPKLKSDMRCERVGITLKENEGTGMKQPVIEQNFSLRAMIAGSVYPANVEVFPLKSNPALGVACLEMKTDLTKWNFLRVYAAFALMPLLGDHLYSARVQSVMGVKVGLPPLSLEPGATHQKLSNEVIFALGFRRSEDSLILPLHAHLQSYSISNYLRKKKPLVISAPPPDFFKWTCNRLGLKLD